MVRSSNFATACLLSLAVSLSATRQTTTALAFLPPQLSHRCSNHNEAQAAATTTTTATSTATKRVNANRLFSTASAKRPDVLTEKSEALAEGILKRMAETSAGLGMEHAAMFGLDDDETDEKNGQERTSAGLFALLNAIKTTLGDGGSLGLNGHPLVLRRADLEAAMGLEPASPGSSTATLFENAFTMADLEKALEDDFLDASRGSTDNRKGWAIAPVSVPRGDSFEEARMTFDDVCAALDKGTVIFNAFGAHVPKLAGPCLAATDATDTPNAVNLYVTAFGKRTSAPPHTDKQDVLVVQTGGKKHWRVYAPTEASVKTTADVFARGKGTDSLPLHLLEAADGDNLLLETDLNPGDVLFIPAGFPHTTGTAHEEDGGNDGSGADKTSIHLTFNIDTHVWELDYLNARRLALRRANIVDSALGQSRDEDNVYVGRVNELPSGLHRDLLGELPLGLLGEDAESSDALVETATARLKELAEAVDAETFAAVEDSVWKETILELRSKGRELVDIHRDMYIAALEEGRTRKAEDAMTAHLQKDGENNRKKPLTQERMQRLSLFRVQKYYELINKVKADLLKWSYEGTSSGPKAGESAKAALPDNWAFVLPVKMGDQVEADLGGAFFPATVTRVLPNGGGYDVKFFDGDQESGMERGAIKLLTPPDMGGDEEEDTSNMTPKQLKRWKKAQKKKKKQ
ncbi:unnamed protein product [Pseudo-nitzschia multistriata]|uniref:Bifunctional lysine-specific demethylase and histidyl-hydroxylase n=1 Tax=Pseudo-nitzschia multistriata TaxID=183589 RepID=A0A448Z5N0_9STRA|nr:unnamed protein product [Pseudo-nitzschia multistriata]